MTRSNGTYTQRFTFVDPSELHLARVACLVQAPLRHFRQLHTRPLPAPHVSDGDRMNTVLYLFSDHSSQATSCRTGECPLCEEPCLLLPSDEPERHPDSLV